MSDINFFPSRNPFEMILPKGSSPDLPQKLVATLNTFEDNLLQRIKNMKPMHIEDALSLSWMKAAMESLSKTHTDVKCLITTLVLPLCNCDWDAKWIDLYFDNNVKLLNICTAFKIELEWLTYARIVAEHALFDLEYTPTSITPPGRPKFDFWMTFIDREKPKLEGCFDILANLINEALDMSKIKSSANIEKVIITAMFGAYVQAVFVCSIIAAAMSRSPKDIIDLKVPETCLWATAFYDVQSFVNVEMQKLYSDGRIMALKEVDEVMQIMEKFCLLSKDGVHSIDAANVSSALKMSTENFSVGLDHFQEEVNGLVEVLQSGTNALLNLQSGRSDMPSFREKYRYSIVEPEQKTPELSGHHLALCFEASLGLEPKMKLPKRLSSRLSPKRFDMLNIFEEKVSQRIKNLKPVDMKDILSLSWMKAATESLSKTHTDLQCLIKALILPLCDYDWGSEWISVYYITSVKFHSICTAFTNELIRLNHCKLLPLKASLDLSTPLKQLQSSCLLQHWRTYISWKDPIVEDCFVILNSLMVEAPDLSKITRFDNEEVIMLAMLGVMAQSVCVFSIIASSLSHSSCAKMNIDLKVPKTCLWATAFCDVQSFVNVEFRNLYNNDKIIEVKEIEEVNRNVEKLYIMIQDGVDAIDGDEVLANNRSELRKSSENLSVGLDHLETEVTSLLKILQPGHIENIYTNKVADDEQHLDDNYWKAPKSRLHCGGRIMLGIWELMKYGLMMLGIWVLIKFFITLAEENGHTNIHLD